MLILKTCRGTMLLLIILLNVFSVTNCIGTNNRNIRPNKAVVPSKRDINIPLQESQSKENIKQRHANDDLQFEEMPLDGNPGMSYVMTIDKNEKTIYLETGRQNDFDTTSEASDASKGLRVRYRPTQNNSGQLGIRIDATDSVDMPVNNGNHDDSDLGRDRTGLIGSVIELGKAHSNSKTKDQSIKEMQMERASRLIGKDMKTADAFVKDKKKIFAQFLPVPANPSEPHNSSSPCKINRGQNNSQTSKCSCEMTCTSGNTCCADFERANKADEKKKRRRLKRESEQPSHTCDALTGAMLIDHCPEDTLPYMAEKCQKSLRHTHPNIYSVFPVVDSVTKWHFLNQNCWRCWRTPGRPIRWNLNVSMVTDNKPTDDVSLATLLQFALRNPAFTSWAPPDPYLPEMCTGLQAKTECAFCTMGPLRNPQGCSLTFRRWLSGKSSVVSNFCFVCDTEFTARKIGMTCETESFREYAHHFKISVTSVAGNFQAMRLRHLIPDTEMWSWRARECSVNTGKCADVECDGTAAVIEQKCRRPFSIQLQVCGVQSYTYPPRCTADGTNLLRTITRFDKRFTRIDDPASTSIGATETSQLALSSTIDEGTNDAKTDLSSVSTVASTIILAQNSTQTSSVQTSSTQTSTAHSRPTQTSSTLHQDMVHSSTSVPQNSAELDTSFHGDTIRENEPFEQDLGERSAGPSSDSGEMSSKAQVQENEPFEQDLGERSAGPSSDNSEVFSEARRREKQKFDILFSGIKGDLSSEIVRLLRESESLGAVWYSVLAMGMVETDTLFIQVQGWFDNDVRAAIKTLNDKLYWYAYNFLRYRHRSTGKTLQCRAFQTDVTEIDRSLLQDLSNCFPVTYCGWTRGESASGNRVPTTGPESDHDDNSWTQHGVNLSEGHQENETDHQEREGLNPNESDHDKKASNPNSHSQSGNTTASGDVSENSTSILHFKQGPEGSTGASHIRLLGNGTVGKNTSLQNITFNFSKSNANQCLVLGPWSTTEKIWSEKMAFGLLSLIYFSMSQ